MLKRYEGNPILAPIESHHWESKMVFNTGAIYLDGRVHLLYRARDEEKEISTFGYASSKDGFHIDERLSYPVFSPEGEIDCYGCEDPRITRLGDRLMVTYTAYGKVPGMQLDSIQIAMTSIEVSDFLAKRWRWNERVYLFNRVDNKNSVLFPEKIKDEYIIIHRIPPHIWIARSDDLIHWRDHNILMSPQGNGWEYFKMGAGGPPIKTDKGWLFIYHAVDKNWVYRLGYAILDLEDPNKVIYRHKEPILEPTEICERTGVVANVVFSCGAVVIDDTLFVYYGGADTVIGVATSPLKDFLYNL